MTIDISSGAAFLLGLLGTGHCLGMCGPLVAILPGAYGRWQAHLYYHAGRLTTYALVGAALGSIGAGIENIAAAGHPSALLWTTRIQVILSLVAAILLLMLGFIRLGLLQEPQWIARLAPQKLPGYSPALHKIQRRGSMLWLFVMGLILGLLPCGLSYAAFARALASQTILDGAGLTLVFGLGTLPGLLILGTGAARLWRRYRVHSEMAAGLLMIAMAASLIAQAWTAGS